MSCNCCTNKNAYIEALNIVPFQDEKLIPDNCFVINDMSGGKYYILKNNYSTFTSIYLNTKTTNHLVMNLNHAITHTLCFDIDIKNDNKIIDINKYISEILLAKFRDFFTCIPCFSVLIARKPSGQGLHVYLPEFRIANDDYHYLCNLLKTDLEIDGAILDIPMNFNMPYASKVGDTGYAPSLFFLILNDKLYYIDLQQDINYLSNTIFDLVANLKRESLALYTAFYLYLNQIPLSRHQLLWNFMLPVNYSHQTTIKRFNIFFPTMIIMERLDHEPLASLEMKLPNQSVIVKYFYKNDEIEIDEKPNFIYNYLKQNWNRIEKITTICNPIKLWWEHFCQKQTTIIKDIFFSTNNMIRNANLNLYTDAHPIKTILSFNNGAYFLPVFFSLCNMLEYTPKELCENIKMLFNENETLLSLTNQISTLDSKLVKMAAEGFTHSTLLYCSVNMTIDTLAPFEMVDKILTSLDFIFDETMSSSQLVQIMNYIIQTYFPIRKLRDKRYFWNACQCQWIQCSNEDVRNIFGLLSDKIICYFSNKFRISAPCSANNLKERVVYVTCFHNLMLENQTFRLDYRKWFLRTTDGVLDILTGNIGLIVPEHYLSDKIILPHFDNINTYIHSNELYNLYNELWQETFFQSYVEQLKKRNLDYMVVLEDMTKEKYGLLPCRNIILQAYIHLCQFFRFKFDEMIHFLYTLSSCLVAGNYGKRLFFLQGQKDNGKSRLVKILMYIFDKYAINVNVDAFAGGRKSETKPEIARHFLECRVLICEELAGILNENYLKLLSSDSHISCRDLFQSPVAGIPTMKLFFTTNNAPCGITTAAFKERVVVYNFAAKFLADITNLNIEEQMENGIFERDFNEKGLPDIASGLFLHMYFLYRDKYSHNDGYLEYLPIPQALKDFKANYLRNTDIYQQFKILMDVQLVQGESTTVEELRTAVRHFLKMTKNSTSISDTELMQKFDDEFANYKSFSNENEFISDSSEDEDEPQKIEETDDKIYIQYVNVAIKNIRKYR